MVESQPVPEAVPWAMQLVARIEKAAPPPTQAVCAAAALATVALLADERSAPGGEWHEPVSTWNGRRIRKIMRRARASAWERAQQVDGVTIVHGAAEVRAFVPCPIDRVPAEVAKLQIQSTPLEPATVVDELPMVDPMTLVVAVTPEVEMSWGKQAAQCAHAGQLLWRASSPDAIAAWDEAGRPVTIVQASSTLWNIIDEVAEVRVHDAGYTEVPPDTNTTRAWWAGPTAQSPSAI